MSEVPAYLVGCGGESRTYPAGAATQCSVCQEDEVESQACRWDATTAYDATKDHECQFIMAILPSWHLYSAHLRTRAAPTISQ